MPIHDRTAASSKSNEQVGTFVAAILWFVLFALLFLPAIAFVPIEATQQFLLSAILIPAGPLTLAALLVSRRTPRVLATSLVAGILVTLGGVGSWAWAGPDASESSWQVLTLLGVAIVLASSTALFRARDWTSRVSTAHDELA